MAFFLEDHSFSKILGKTKQRRNSVQNPQFSLGLNQRNFGGSLEWMQQIILRSYFFVYFRG
jgi:hypothetical protein